jgi:hypothetical protein
MAGADGGIYEIDGVITDADVGTSEIDEGADADVGVVIDVLVGIVDDKGVSVATDTVSNSCFRVACRAARGIDGWDAILGDT